MDLNLNVRITFDETPALLNCFAALTECLERLAKPRSVFEAMGDVVESAAEAQAVAAPKAEPAPAAAPEPAPAAVPTAPAHTYTIEEIQAACGPLMDAGKMSELAGLLQKFGVASLPELPKDKYGALAVELRALGARL